MVSARQHYTPTSMRRLLPLRSLIAPLSVCCAVRRFPSSMRCECCEGYVYRCKGKLKACGDAGGQCSCSAKTASDNGQSAHT